MSLEQDVRDELDGRCKALRRLPPSMFLNEYNRIAGYLEALEIVEAIDLQDVKLYKSLIDGIKLDVMLRR